MPWFDRPPPRIWRAIACLVLPVVCFLSPAGAMAQGIESILAPGKVIQGHAKVEEDCKQCHVKFDRKAQDGLCIACHKDVGTDVRNRMGFHGRAADPTCRSCHTDHKGRDIRIADFDKKKFDHAKTDFLLRGKHEKLECDKCHVSGKRYREAALDCNSCHRKDDVHKASLGPKCADCHTESSWKEARFDHETTRFSLTGKHLEVKCTDCHRNNQYKETPKQCYACHRKDDDQKGHRGQFGDKCESCHTTKLWKSSSFNHDIDTKYALRGKHRSAICKDCHTGNLYKEKLSQDCYACHKNDDKHKESLGKDCGSCHGERSWKEPPKFDHGTTSFPLLGKHAKEECKACHKSAMFKEAPKQCYGCHQKDDKHQGNLGKECADCHTERDWKNTDGRFQHDRTKFALRNAHASAAVKCVACHKNLQSFRNTATDCFSCHKKDDKHDGQAGTKCEQCHSDRSWKVTKFDHSMSRFALTGRHLNAPCKGCHETSRYKDAPSDCFSCHKKEDKHLQKFGMRCDTCHNTRAWSVWGFDHDSKTKYRLEGAHRKVPCESCHTQPAPKGKNAATAGSNCIACHRSDDVHDGQFGVRCEQCHTVDRWKNFKGRVSQYQPTSKDIHSAAPGFVASNWRRYA